MTDPTAPTPDEAAAHPTGDNACTVCHGQGTVHEDGYYVPGEQFVEPPYEARCEACVGSGQREVQWMATELVAARDVVSVLRPVRDRACEIRDRVDLTTHGDAVHRAARYILGERVV